MKPTTVLCVDDDPGMREFYRDLLNGLGYVPLVAKIGHDALRLLFAREEEVAIVVSDYAMPNMDGASLAARIKRHYPSLPVILVMAAPQLSADLTHCIDAVVEKPCPPQSVVDQIRTLLERQASNRSRESRRAPLQRSSPNPRTQDP